jgi:hypothetical protein
LQNCDCADPGTYFVAIYTKHKRPFFGEIGDDAMSPTICTASSSYRKA